MPGTFAASARLPEVKRLRDLRLCCLEECSELGEVHAVFAVIVRRIAADLPRSAIRSRRFSRHARRRRIARRPGERDADQPFEAAFGGVGSHDLSPLLLCN